MTKNKNFTYFKRGHIPWHKGTKGVVKPNSGSFKKGISPWNENTKGLIKAWNKGKKLSQEYKIKLSLSHTGKIHTIECKRKISEKLKGRISPMKGRHHSKEYKENQRKRMKELRPFITYPSKDTSIETKLQNALRERGISFIPHKSIIGQPDIFIYPNVCIFADGCYWHDCPIHFPNGGRKNSSDKEINKKLMDSDYIVLRFWEHDINDNIEFVINKISSSINS